jgi:hypothetical protein
MTKAGMNTISDIHYKYISQFQITRCTRRASSAFASTFSTNEKSAPPLATPIKWANRMYGVSPTFSLPQIFVLLYTMSDYSTPFRSDSYGYPAFNPSAFHPSQGPDHLDLNSNSSTNTPSFSPEPFESHSPPSQLAHPKLSALFVDQVAQQYHITDPSQLERLHVFFGVSFIPFNTHVATVADILSSLGMLWQGLYLLLTWAPASKCSLQLYQHKTKSSKLCHRFLILAWVSTSNPCSRIWRPVSKTHSSLPLNKVYVSSTFFED